MGEVYADVLIGANGKRLTKHLLVDTGATYSWLHARDLKKLGVRPLRWEHFETIEGKPARRRLGEVRVSILGRTATTVVVLARPTDSEVLGLHALEGLALEVDPTNRTLSRCKAIKALRQDR